ncbi:tetratricopeptide repeat protein [Shewanella electrodiphila]|uniref:Tetratricopeptide repeat protein n=1 Tax=Shewanella electrodiphila TaxID=934143 RepID=A0ABT0KT33_9GAMM|nr:multiheme c-type cytochrome [Shewanella electrodiphila]MCL1046824.1 tetratricopeptide repeat protein [Shewanella electrodiphila]
MKFNQLVVFIRLVIIFVIHQTHSVAADYVGAEQCVDCHQQQYSDWQASHHDMSMRHAGDDSVLGDFDNQTLQENNQSHRFYRKNSQYWVNTKGPDGKSHDYEISYTFGYEPLQQYMVKFPDGRVQLIPLAWDSRDKSQGGQRWFNLYPDMDVHDEFFWTNNGQNWNYMCADCHSTNIDKNYDSKTNTYNTTWSEINVGCEACHGPASEHIIWAQTPNNTNPLIGFDRNLKPKVGSWEFTKGQKILQPKQLTDSEQLDTCAQCHSRRAQLNNSHDPIKGDFFDKYNLNAITPSLYYPDGQIYEEVFVMGSFKQSKMHAAGVVCSDCHNPHSTKLKAPIESICFQCHLPSEYTSAKHSQHQDGTEAAQCVTCHMPKTIYMEVDPRADHSFQIPRPDISKKIGTPNVCTSCHNEKSNQWAVNALEKQFPDSSYQNSDSFSLAFAQASAGVQTSGDKLSYIAQNHLESNIIRASALSRMDRFPSQNTMVAVMRGIKHKDPQMRLGALTGSAPYPFNDRWQIVSPLLSDPVYAVRTETASTLVSEWQNMNDDQRALLTPALNEYIEIQQFNSDRGFGLMNLGNIHNAKGNIRQAEKLYLKAIEIEPIFATSYANLADLYRQRGDDKKSLETLKKGIANQPKAALLRYSAGLNLYRQQQLTGAIDYLEQATEIEATNPQYWYVLGLAQEKVSVTQAMKSLTKAYEVGGNPQHLYALCEFKIRHRDPTTQACINQLAKIVPPQVVQQLIGQ